jgi:hypothetical protein
MRSGENRWGNGGDEPSAVRSSIKRLVGYRAVIEAAQESSTRRSAGFVMTATEAGANTIELNLAASDITPLFDEVRHGAASLVVPEWLVRRNEPLSRGGGKAHMCQFAYRTGGTSVWVCQKYPRGVGDAEHARLLATNPKAHRWNWQRMTRDPELYVKGRVSHSDHKTVVLDGWRRVAMNTEWQAPFAHNVVFLD